MNHSLAEKEYLTVSDIKTWLNISQGAAYGLTHRADFPVCHFGGAIRIPRIPFLDWVSEHTSNPMNFGSESRREVRV